MTETRWLRVTYWTGAILDFVMAFVVLIPDKMGVESYVYPMGLISAVAVSWGILLIFADQSPMERRWVLLPTMIVVVLLQAATFLSLRAISIPLWQLALTLVMSATVFSVSLYSHRNTNNKRST